MWDVTRFLTAVRFLIENFLAPFAFFVVFRLRGTKPAIAVALAILVLQAGYFWLRRIRFSPFFITAGLVTLLTGTADLLVTHPHYFRLSPAGQNFFIALLLLVAMAAHLPVIEWFASGLPARFRPDLTKLPREYPRRVAWLFVAYFVAKGGLYLYLAFEVDLGELVILRSIIGPISFGLLVLAEWRLRHARRSPA
jgi:intracellular septation protein A